MMNGFQIWIQSADGAPEHAKLLPQMSEELALTIAARLARSRTVEVWRAFRLVAVIGASGSAHSDRTHPS
jgi:hypothetical protein